ncbi:glycine cleavage system protein GcvH [Rhodohalobacter sulfatireducens]|uniref:Glycine cleavage system H protein n=1 Tax=Rhodohalobacter sulfatireducens TaxID=2911366 RepID=A0ABS9KGU5_9BACT|nr:glycine cleavage system protein GcvH [Rhodohalobacter sulfatireducens]MCG2590079.1 glycine cleavage system protein GcvH [Rhodohalobacter sulfatireducens]MDR9366037.1 glycine cleavage system protein GcvH [Balneolaceae bacterium]
MKFPEDLKYTKEHEWVRDNGDGTATVGITDFAQGELGDIVFVELEPEGSEFDQDEVFGTVEAVKTVSELFCPIAGEITEINEVLEDEPELVNTDPYGKGWMVKIKMGDGSDLDSLLSVEDYKEIVE